MKCVGVVITSYLPDSLELQVVPQRSRILNKVSVSQEQKRVQTKPVIFSMCRITAYTTAPHRTSLAATRAL